MIHRTATQVLLAVAIVLLAARSIPAACTWSISPTAISAPAAGMTNATIYVTTQAGCYWMVYNISDSWITVGPGQQPQGTGSGQVTFVIAPNTSTSQRTGTVSIIEPALTVTITQAGAGTGCTYSISAASASAAAGGGTGSVGVTAGSGCTWTASSNASWISVTAGALGNGNGTVQYSVTASTSTSSRTGTLTIAGLTFTVTQTGAAPACTYSISPATASPGAAATTGSVAVTATSGCSWTAASSAGWISITSGASGTGNGTVGYSVAANTGASSRTGTLTIAGQTFTVTQAAATGPPPAGPPAISDGGVVNAADFTANLAPGMIISIFGQNLASSLQNSGSPPLATTLNGTSVQAVVGSQTVALPLFFVSSSQINAQLPFAVSPGSIGIQVRTAAGTSAVQPITIQARSPRLFTVPSGGTGTAALLHANYDVVTDQLPANPGEWVIVYLTGLGAVSPAVAPGQAAGDGAGLGPLSNVTDTVSVTVNGSPAQVYFAGLAPLYAGLYQVNFKVPDDTPLGPAEVVVSVTGSSSQPQVTFQTSLHWLSPAVKTIGPAGGTVAGSDISVTVPAGALASSQDVKVYESSGPAPDAAERVGPVFRLEGLPVTTASPITVTVQVPGSTVPAQGTYLVLEEPDGGQMFVQATVSGSQVTATLPVRKGAPVSSPAAASGKAMASYAAGDSSLTNFLLLWITTGVHDVVSPKGYFDVVYVESGYQSVKDANTTIAGMEAALDELIAMGFDSKIRASLPIQVRFSPTFWDASMGWREVFGQVATVKWSGQRMVRLSSNYGSARSGTELEYYPDQPVPELRQAKGAHVLFHYVQQLYDGNNRDALRDQQQTHPWAWWDEATALVFEEHRLTCPPEDFLNLQAWTNRFSSGPENSNSSKEWPVLQAHLQGEAYALFVQDLWNQAANTSWISNTYRRLDAQGAKLLPSQAVINELDGNSLKSAWLAFGAKLASGKVFPTAKDQTMWINPAWCPIDAETDLSLHSNYSKTWSSPDLSAYALAVKFSSWDPSGSIRKSYNNPATRVSFTVTGAGAGYLWIPSTKQLVTLGSDPYDVPYTDQMWNTTPFYLLVSNSHINQTQPHSDPIGITVKVVNVPQNLPRYLTFKWSVPSVLPGNPDVNTILPAAYIWACPPAASGSYFCGPIQWSSTLEFSFTSSDNNVSLNGRLSSSENKLEYFHIDLKNVAGMQYWFTHGVSITVQNLVPSSQYYPSYYVARFGDIKKNFASYVTQFTYTLAFSKDGSTYPGSPFHLGVADFKWSDDSDIAVEVDLLQ